MTVNEKATLYIKLCNIFGVHILDYFNVTDNKQ